LKKKAYNKWFEESCKRVMAERDLAQIEELKDLTKTERGYWL